MDVGIWAILIITVVLVKRCEALRCHDCQICANPGYCNTDGKCFIRQDPDGNVFRGCADVSRWSGLDLSYSGCRKQVYGGATKNGKYQKAEWCLCDDGDDCNRIALQSLRKGVYEADLQLVIELSGLTEGPIFDHEGALYVTDIVFSDIHNNSNPVYHGVIQKIDVDTKTSQIFLAPFQDGQYGVPNGLEMDREGNIFDSDVQFGLLRVTPGGDFSQVATHDSSGNHLKGMNDLTFDYNGNLWITAPWLPLPVASQVSNMELTELVNGSIYCSVGASDQIIHLESGLYFPNGIAVQHDRRGNPKVLIVAEMYPKILWAYDIIGPCQVTNKRIWGTVPGKYNGGPDGIEFDKNNNLLVTTYFGGAIYVFGRNGGKPITRIDMPFAAVTNVEFAPNSRTVYVTEGSQNSVWRFDWKYKGKTPFSMT